MDDAPRVLLVEDEPAIREPLSAALTAAGMRSCTLADGRRFTETLDDFRPDLAILDVMLPGRDGFALAHELRRRDDAPILFLTGRDELTSRLRGFEAGADDYVIKPFLTEELLARVRALLRRSGRLRSAVSEIGDLIIDEAQGSVTRAGHPVSLTQTEFRLLEYLSRHRGRPLSKLQLLTQVWGYEAYDPNLVEVHVSALRRKLEERGSRVVHTVRGRGYMLRV